MGSQPQLPNGLKFAFGGASGMAACFFTQPLDLVKNRMQVSGEGGKARDHRTTFHAIRSIFRNEGPLGFYNGLSAGLFRQGTYTTLRLGLYTFMFDRFSSSNPKAPLSFGKKVAIGFAAGGVSSLICTPADVGLVRMTVDGRLPLAERRGYRNVFHALYRVAHEEGVVALWRGCGPTVVRAMVVNAAQLATYSQAKQTLLGSGYFKDNVMCHFSASMISGFACTAASMPVDIAKTRIQNMRVVNGVPEYSGSIDVIRKIIRQEGVFSLWKGFTPAFMRLGPHTVLVFLFLEQFNKLYFRSIGLQGKAAL
uniref:Mitochondrial 2-oxoglutarate/malate carrier protein n=1 Tax=Plectus sambesii TaxID=2011161 RepID=A0A914XTX3_9BILA